MKGAITCPIIRKTELRTGAVTPKSAGITWLMKKTGAERGKPRR
ncbi:MAG: hypothetical protein NTV10_08585 [Methanoregula sp.]|nr:hypothetical protein [Methanoregula sp.]